MNNPRRSFCILMLVSLALRLVWAASLETGLDESYHFLYSIHPDWSYFDHPPMLMYVTRFGIALFGGWLHPLSLRIGFVLLFSGSTWIMFRWTSRWYGELAGFYAAFALNVSAYYEAGVGAFVLPDGPLLFFALLTMWQLSEALIAHPGKIGPWIRVGVGCAGTMLSKYHAVLLPVSVLVYLLVTPSVRAVLLTPGPYLASLIGFVGLIPVLVWNAEHDWISFGFQSARGIGGQLQLGGLAVMLFGPIAILLPWIWYSLMEGLVVRLWRFRSVAGIERLLVCLAVVPLGLFTAVSITRSILPHWPLIGFVPLYPLLGANWVVRTAKNPARVRHWMEFMTAFLLVLAGLFLAQARFGLVQLPFRDPTIEISGWQSVGDELRARGYLDRPNTFFFTDHWFDSGQIAFAIRNQMPVACYKQGDSRGFAFWSHPDDWLGKDGILIDGDLRPDIAQRYESYFRQITPLEPIQMTRGGRPYRLVNVYLCVDQLHPFPFTYERKSR